MKDRFAKAHSDKDIDSVLCEYRRFMELKVAMGDYDATQLSPSPLVDAMWHLHILDTRQYLAMCSEQPSFIHHNPDGCKDLAARRSRYQTTLLAYRARFGEPAPSAIWPHNLYDTDIILQDGTGINPQQDKVIIPQKAKSIDKFKLIVNDVANGEKIILNVTKHLKVYSIQVHLAKHKGVRTHEMRLLCLGWPMSSDGVLADYELEDGDEVDLMLKQYGC